MRSPVYFFLYFVLISSTLLVSCYAPKALEYRGYQNLSISKIRFDSSVVTLDIIYYNPNGYGMQLKKADLDIYIDSNYMGHTSQRYKIKIPRKDEFTVPLSLSIDMHNLLKNALSSFFTQQVDIKASGSVTVQKMLIPIHVPINYEGIQHFKIN